MIPATTSKTPAAHRRQAFNVCTFLVVTCRHFWSSLVVTFCHFRILKEGVFVFKRGYFLTQPTPELFDPTYPWTPLVVAVVTCRHHRHRSSLVVTVVTCRHHRHFWVVITFVVFPLPLRVAFAATLIYDPSHNLQDPCSTQEASI